MGTIYKGGVAYAGSASNPGTMVLGGIVAGSSSLPNSSNEGTVYLVGSAAPYKIYIYASGAWREVDFNPASLTNFSSLTVGSLAVTNRLTIPTSAPASPAVGDFWVE